MGSKIEYVDSSQVYAARYARNSRAIGVLWAVFTVCYAVVGAAALAAPEWLGGEGGRAGLFTACLPEEEGERCIGGFEDPLALREPGLRVAAALITVGAALAVLAVCAMGGFLFCHSTTVYHICAWVQLLSALCMIAGCSTYPSGWSDEEVRKICGNSDKYELGKCGVRWAYLLAAIGCLDAAILSTLAFILATRHIRLQPEPHYAPASLYKGEMNNGFIGDAASVAGSRKSLNLHPVLLMHPGQDDTYSQFSQRTVPRSTHSGHYSHPMHHNFQL